MPKVLIVDDEPNVRWTMSEFLIREGFDTVVAHDYSSAVAAVGEEVIDVAVIDIILPGKSGIELLKWVHGSERQIPVVMITADPDLSQIPEIVREGAYDFIPKPVVKAVLINTVSRAVEKQRLIEEKRNLEAQLKGHALELEKLVDERTAELAEAHHFLNAVLESSTEYAILAVDNMGCITLFNRGAELMFGCRSAQMVGHPADDLFVEQSQGSAEKFLLRGATHEQGGRQLETRLRRHDGNAFYASVVVTPIRRTDDGPILGYLGIIDDLTSEREREEGYRQMQARLAHSEKIAALGRAAAQVAHEVKNPLAGLRLYALVLKKKAAGQLAAEEMELVDEILRAIDHLTENVDRVLDFARPVSLLLRRADLNEIVRNALRMLEPQLALGRVEKRLNLCEAGTMGMLDETSLRPALFNLLLNAVQAMPAGGTLNVTCRKAGTDLRLTITDTGIGMTEDQLPKIFEPFYTTKGQGLGLGLPYARKVIEQHQGTIEVESLKNQGTKISITLPAEP